MFQSVPPQTAAKKDRVSSVIIKMTMYVSFIENTSRLCLDIIVIPANTNSKYL